MRGDYVDVRANTSGQAAGISSSTSAPPAGSDVKTSAASGPSSNPARVFVAIGSNIGDRIGHLRRAVDHVARQDGIKLVSTSRLYESEPMYVEDQDRFINGVIEVSSPSRDTRRLLVVHTLRGAVRAATSVRIT
jgi:dihydroneopterin aldolase/2-amino-4-hydroxy-6-hydroxymethyldihydropteridine diphosphokinase/dihydropteroate synthase